MVHAQAVLHGDRDRLLGFDSVERPLALQLGGSEPEALAEATWIAASLDFDEVNLNVGCPSDRVQAGRFGACLMRDPALVADCVAAMRAAIVHAEAQVTVKCRLGVDEVEDYGTFRAFVDAIAATGCSVFAVHARKAWLQGLSPKENREIPPLRYDWVYRLKQERPDLTVLINGGIASVDAALAHLEHVDGVMLGRVAYHDPYVLHRLDNALSDESDVPREDLLLRMRPYVERQLAHGIAIKHIVRHVLGLFHGQPGGRAFRQVLSEGAHRPGADWTLIERALAVTRHPTRHAA
jgi:tRNA-dihydrouridine synthase A